MSASQGRKAISMPRATYDAITREARRQRRSRSAVLEQALASLPSTNLEDSPLTADEQAVLDAIAGDRKHRVDLGLLSTRLGLRQAVVASALDGLRRKVAADPGESLPAAAARAGYSVRRIQ